MSTGHPTPAEIVDLHFGEGREDRRRRVELHVAGCPRCADELAGMQWMERSLDALPDEEPPADGLERVLARVDLERATQTRRTGWMAPVAATLAGMTAAAAVIYAAGTRAAGLVSGSGPLVDASGLGLAALTFFGIGSLVTLALAPALLMEAQSRRRALAGR